MPPAESVPFAPAWEAWGPPDATACSNNACRSSSIASNRRRGIAAGAIIEHRGSHAVHPPLPSLVEPIQRNIRRRLAAVVAIAVFGGCLGQGCSSPAPDGSGPDAACLGTSEQG